MASLNSLRGGDWLRQKRADGSGRQPSVRPI